MMSSQSSCYIPFAHYALIYVDSTGKLRWQESASVMERDTTLFTLDIRQAFLETLGEKVGFHQTISGCTSIPPLSLRVDTDLTSISSTYSASSWQRSHVHDQQPFGR